MDVKKWIDKNGFEYIEVDGKVYIEVSNVIEQLEDFKKILKEEK